MSKKKKKPFKKKASFTTKRKNSGKFLIILKFVFLNIGILIVSVLMFYLLIKYHKGYKWVFNDLIKNSIALVHKFNKTNVFERYEAKLGFSYTYLDFLKNNTPEDAIIIMPPDSILLQTNSNKETAFSSHILDYKWASYFVYPRKLVYESHHKNTFLFKKANYRAIVNYYGYDQLNFTVFQKYAFTVLPLMPDNIHN